MTDTLRAQPADTKPEAPITVRLDAGSLPHRSTAIDIASGVVAGAAGTLAATALEAALFKNSGQSFGERFKRSHITSSVHVDTALFGMVGGYAGYVHAKSYNRGVEDGTNAAISTVAQRVRESQQKSAGSGKDGPSK